MKEKIDPYLDHRSSEPLSSSDWQFCFSDQLKKVVEENTPKLPGTADFFRLFLETDDECRLKVQAFRLSESASELSEPVDKKCDITPEQGIALYLPPDFVNEGVSKSMLGGGFLVPTLGLKSEVREFRQALADQLQSSLE